MLGLALATLALLGTSQAASLKPIEYKNLNIESCDLLKDKSTTEARQYLQSQGASPDNPICTIVAMMKLSLDPHEQDVALLSQRLDWIAPIDRSGPGSLLDGDDESIPAITALSRYRRTALPEMYAAAASSGISSRASRSAVLVIARILGEDSVPACNRPISEVTEFALRTPAKRQSLANDVADAERSCAVQATK